MIEPPVSELRIRDVRTGNIEPDVVGEVKVHLSKGGLLAYPTETVYGLGALATPKGVEALTRVKRRAAEKPFLLLIPSADSVADLRWTAPARDLCQVFWPGALTLILSDPERRFPAGVRSETGGVAVRMSPHPVVRELLEAVGEPILSTSANLSGEDAGRSAQMVSDLLLQSGAADHFILLDAGELPESAASTLVDCSSVRPVVLRAGPVPVDRLRCVVPGIHLIGEGEGTKNP